MLGWYRWMLLSARFGPLVPSLNAIGTTNTGTVSHFSAGAVTTTGISKLVLLPVPYSTALSCISVLTVRWYHERLQSVPSLLVL